MAWIFALLSFAGIMAILSTIVSASVEAIHKSFSLRKNGLREMLRAIHDSVVIDIESGGAYTRRELNRSYGRSKKAAQFAQDMTKSPSYGGGGRWWWISNWKLNIFQRHYDKLTRRQFVEQIANTEFGENLSRQDRTAIRQALAKMSYEFDRFGVAQREYFKRRAKMLSGLVAFVFVCLANINAFSLYVHLANDDEALTNTLTFLGVEDSNQLAVRVSDLRYQLESARSNLEAKDLSEDQQAIAQLQEASAQLNGVMNELTQDSRLPIGDQYFPYCSNNATIDTKCHACLLYTSPSPRDRG